MNFFFFSKFFSKILNKSVPINCQICNNWSNSTDGTVGRRIIIFYILFYKNNNHCNLYISWYDFSCLRIKELPRSSEIIPKTELEITPSYLIWKLNRKKNQICLN